MDRDEVTGSWKKIMYKIIEWSQKDPATLQNKRVEWRDN